MTRCCAQAFFPPFHPAGQAHHSAGAAVSQAGFMAQAARERRNGALFNAYRGQMADFGAAKAHSEVGVECRGVMGRGFQSDLGYRARLFA